MLMVGSIRCYFFSFFQQGRKPLLSIGPSWPFTLGLLAFAGFAFVYFLWMLYLLQVTNAKVKAGALVYMVSNVLMLLTGILKNPGIP